MFTEQKVIYVARTVQDAYMLRNLLAEERIQAVVINEVLEGGSGVDIVGWPTSARVVVAEADAERARPIAVRFDRKLASAAVASDAALPGEVPPAWPRCPACDTPRWTRCPVCHTAGTDFRPADEAPLEVLGADAAAQAATSCGCGPEGCTPSGVAGQEQAAQDAAAADQGEPQPAREMLLCPTCDEPFAPQYRRTCQSCGHQFADGYEPDLAEESDEPVNVRIIAAFVGMLALLLAIAVYLAFIL
jgi:hypothetical protein